jgi:aryl-alcohol dehydrogenase-like predicted oxidoreductase
MKLVLGSASWRAQYGPFSKHLLTDKQISDLAIRAALLGFDFIDTAPTYGDVEEALGRVKPKQCIATKVTVDPSDFSSIQKSVNLSRKKFGIESLDLIFVHNWDMLSESEKYISVEVLQKCILEQSIKRWGFSTYDVSELKKLKVNGWTNLNIQINSNILDQRLLEIDSTLWGKVFEDQNIEIWIRSGFLQGVLLDESLKNPFIGHPDIINFYSICSEHNVSPLELCLAYVRQIAIVDRVIIGIENELQLAEITNAIQVKVSNLDFHILESKDIRLIDPRHWEMGR